MKGKIKKGFLFVISGPSGSGKTTLLKRILKSKRLKDKVLRSVSLTTRPARQGEINGEDYFFISKEEFKKRLKQKKILEYTHYLGYDYATPKDFVEEKLLQGKHLVLCLDHIGALNIKKIYPQNTVTIFIKPPSLASLYQRIKNRACRTSSREIQKRLKIAQKELKRSGEYDYCIINKDLKKATQKLEEIILKYI